MPHARQRRCRGRICASYDATHRPRLLCLHTLLCFPFNNAVEGPSELCDEAAAMATKRHRGSCTDATLDACDSSVELGVPVGVASQPPCPVSPAIAGVCVGSAELDLDLDVDVDWLALCEPGVLPDDVVALVGDLDPLL
jgi:hypothetical protein